MARYYCEYCHSYLTHDTLSVRKSHLIGKNHLRIVADYYRNKATQHENTHERSKKRQNKNHSKTGQPQTRLPLRCATNRDKKRLNRTARYHRTELHPADEESLLQKMYDGSPGYSKVFIAGNRLDIGDLVRSSRLPQRANAAEPHNQAPSRTRNELYKPAQHEFSLEPPRVLAQWQTTLPKQALYHDERLLKTAINESRKRIHTRKRKN